MRIRDKSMVYYLVALSIEVAICTLYYCGVIKVSSVIILMWIPIFQFGISLGIHINNCDRNK